MSTKVGDMVYVRARITGQTTEHAGIPAIPVDEIDQQGVVLASGWAHPEAVVTAEQIRIRMMAKEGATT